MSWDFTRLPSERHEEAIIAHDRRDWRTLLKLHNEYKISGYNYCCSYAAEAMMSYFEDAINKSIICAEEKAKDNRPVVR